MRDITGETLSLDANRIELPANEKYKLAALG